LVGRLSSSSTALEFTARSLTMAAGKGSQQATSVAAGTGLHAVAAASEELTASINEISRRWRNRPTSPVRQWMTPNAPARSCVSTPTKSPMRQAALSATFGRREMDDRPAGVPARMILF
jgi:hypothetical protein